jgi:SAM-dependent methyltransferase
MKPSVIFDPKYNFLRLDPIPTQAEVDEFYAKEFYASNAAYFNNSALALQEEQAEFFNSRWEAILEIYEKYQLSGERSVFDIGFGFAQALKFFKKNGFKVAGLEPSEEGVTYAKSFGIEAHHTGIENLECTKGEKFDLVLLINVLEHLRKPSETLLNIKSQLLKDDGILVIDVPNDFNDFQEIATKEFNLEKWWVVAPNHINYFSPDSLKSLCEQCGYEVLHCESSFPLDIFLLFGDVYVNNKELGRACHNKRVMFETLMKKYGKAEKLRSLYQKLAELNLGRSTSIYVRPKK